MTVHQQNGLWQLDWRPWLLSSLEQSAAGLAVETLAAQFHQSLAAALAELAVQALQALQPDSGATTGPVVRVALAGGCFQNAALLRHTATELRRRGLQPFWSEQLPCHDGGLALGQIAAWRRQIAADAGPSGSGLHS